MGDTRFDALTLVTAPTSDPVSIDDAKTHMRVEDTEDDAYIGSLIKAATAFVDADGVLGRAMVTQTWAQHGYGWSGRVALTMTPVQSLSAVKYYDVDNALQTATLSDFRLIGTPKDSFVEPVSSWPATFDRPDALRLEYVAGYGASSAVPVAVQHAMLMLIAHWYENREEASEVSLKRAPLGFEALINKERASWYG